MSLLPKHVARGSVACAGLIMFHITVIWTDILTCVIFLKIVFIAIGFHSASETWLKIWTSKSIFCVHSQEHFARHVAGQFAAEYVYE